MSDKLARSSQERQAKESCDKLAIKGLVTRAMNVRILAAKSLYNRQKNFGEIIIQSTKKIRQLYKNFIASILIVVALATTNIYLKKIKIDALIHNMLIIILFTVC
jgi:hypothetical protein